MKKRQILTRSFDSLFFAILFIAITATQVFAQAPNPAVKEESNMMWYLFLFALVVLLIGAIYWRYRTQQIQAVEGTGSVHKSNNEIADSDLAWLRRNGNSNSKKDSKNGRHKKALKVSIDFDESFFNPLPVFTFRNLKVPVKFDALPISNNEDLMNAVEQIQDEVEEDEEIRNICLNILTEFKTQNSVETISEMALYDLSATIRSRALGILADFDHESVFEPILLACADPTREVRAAAARALFHLSFNRADAWARIAFSKEHGRMVQMARAAIEGDLVKRSFERLVHKDRKYAYEAFALLNLLIKAGEIDIIFESLKEHTDVNVQNAILHTIKTTKDENALAGLSLILDDKSIKPEVQKEIGKTIEEIGLATV